MKKVLFVSLGCDKNSVDSEKMISDLVKHGFDITNDESEAEVVVINTCCFIGDAKQESIDTIIEFGKLKKDGNLKFIVACGCLAQRYTNEIANELPEVDAIIGTTSYDEIINVIDNLYKKELNKNRGIISNIKDIDILIDDGTDRIQITPGHYNYLKIAEGCNKNCTYCIIPKVRGKYRSVPMDKLIEEASKLALKGCKELILVAQETTMYGVDLYGKKSLGDLILKLEKIEGIKWIRILYMYPEEITDELVDVISRSTKVCKYFDLPIQHCENRILKAMGRRTTKEDLISKINMIRTKIPDATLRTTLITGFPGETDEEFEKLVEFVKEIKFDKLGCFAYSQEEGTKACEMDNQIDEEIKEKRKDVIMSAQQDIVSSKLDDIIGDTLEVLIEGKLTGEDVYVGRSKYDTPNVDGYVFVNSSNELNTSDIIKVKITSHYSYDLIGDEIQ